jgi:hypothetical protein
MTGTPSRREYGAGASPRPDRRGRARSRHGFGTVPSPTRATFRGRLEAIGLGRWASLYPGARGGVGVPRHDGRRPQ